MDHVELVGVVDIKPGRADEMAAALQTQAFTDAAAVLSMVDAVAVAVPTESHVDVALPFIERGVAVLVEKPLAASLADADRLIAAAERHGVLLAAGHTERFNPAVAAALPLVSSPRFVEVHRLGTFPERSLDIDVIFDLMIHDLDLLLASVRSEVTSVEAVGVHVLTPRTDIANARLRFASGCIANLTASRISRERVRKARFFQHDSYVSIDFAAQDVEVYRLVRRDPSAGSGVPGRPIIEGGKLDVPRDEPLRRELADFVDAVRMRRAPGVTARQGRQALALATRIAEQMESTDPLGS
jgi:predicted dehydrogenase